MTTQFNKGSLYLVDTIPMVYLGWHWERDCHQFLNLRTMGFFFFNPDLDDDDYDDTLPPYITDVPNDFTFTVSFTKTGVTTCPVCGLNNASEDDQYWLEGGGCLGCTLCIRECTKCGTPTDPTCDWNKPDGLCWECRVE